MEVKNEKEENIIEEYEIGVKKFTEYSKVGRYSEIKKEFYEKLDLIQNNAERTREEQLYNISCYFEDQVNKINQTKESILSFALPVEILLLTLIFGEKILGTLGVLENVIVCILFVGVLVWVIVKEFPWKEERYYNYFNKLVKEYIEENREYTVKQFKIKREVVEEYKRTSEAMGVSQDEKIEELMRGFIEEVNAEKATE